MIKKVVSFAFANTLETAVSGKLYASILQAFVVVSCKTYDFGSYELMSNDMCIVLGSTGYCSSENITTALCLN